MSEAQSYPSPNAAQMAAGAAGLYAHPNGNISPSAQDSAVDPHLALQGGQHIEEQLTAQLARAAEAPMTAPQNQQHGLSVASHIGQVHTPMQHPATPQQMAQNAMNLAPDPHYGAQPDSNQRKRSKVSRACDECRRKKGKIRCDATSENGPEACTSCKRTGARCQFSRQPMKRGPSKGYIKELADRLSRLEYEQQQQLGHSPQSTQQHQQHTDLQNLYTLNDQAIGSLQDFSPSTSTQFGNGRKRTHSMSEGLDNSQYRTSLSQPPNGAQQPWERRESFPGFEQEPAAAFFEFSQTADLAVGEYYRLIQESYPILPFDARNLKARLGDCNVRVREGFLAALDCAVRSWPSAALPPEPIEQERSRKAYQILSSCVGAPMNKSSGILLVQGFLLLIIESDQQGIDGLDIRSGSLKDASLGQAAGLCSAFQLNTMQYGQRRDNLDFDNDENLGRKVFWILFILDHWHAMSTSSEPKISDERNHLTIDDETLFGPVTFAMARFSLMLAQVSAFGKMARDVATDATVSDIMALHNPVASVLKFSKRATLSSLERFNETLPQGAHPLVLLSYWHVRLLIVRFFPHSSPVEILQAAQAIVSLFNNHALLLTSPYHHFAALAGLVLGELAEKDETRDEALRSLNDLDGFLTRSKTEGSQGWDVSIREYVVKKGASVNESAGGASTTMLEHLAEAAVGERQGSKGAENRPASSGGADGAVKEDVNNAAAAAAAAATAAAALNQSLHFDPAALLRDGYLRVLAQVLSSEAH